MKAEACCTDKKTKRKEEQKKTLLNRLHRIEGQVRGLTRMIENDAYCNDILQQSAAVTAALGAFNREVLAAHIRGCVARDLKNGDDTVIEELMDTLRKLTK